MEEETLRLAQTLARQSLDEDEAGEAVDGSPKPLRKNHLGKLQGFRSVLHRRESFLHALFRVRILVFSRFFFVLTLRSSSGLTFYPVFGAMMG